MAKAMAGHSDPHFGLKPYPVPDSICDAGLAVLCRVMNWRWAAKAFFCGYLLFSGYSWLWFLRTLGGHSSYAAWIAPSLITVNLCCWYGFIGFEIGVAVMLLFCSKLLREGMSVRAAACLLAVVFFCHAIPFVVCSAALLWFIVSRRDYRLLLAYIPSVLLGIWYVLGRFLLGGNAEETILKDVPIPYFSKMFVAYKLNTYFKSLGYVDPHWGDTPILQTLAGGAGVYVAMAVCAVLGAAVLVVLFRAGGRAVRSGAREQFLWWTVLLTAALGMLCPSRTLGISDPGARFLVCALALGILLARPRGRAGAVAAIGSVIVGVAGAGLYAVVASQPGRAAAQGAPLPYAVRQFARVSPLARGFYYDLLAQDGDDCPVFGTALLYNRGEEPCRSAEQVR